MTVKLCQGNVLICDDKLVCECNEQCFGTPFCRFCFDGTTVVADYETGIANINAARATCEGCGGIFGCRLWEENGAWIQQIACQYDVPVPEEDLPVPIEELYDYCESRQADAQFNCINGATVLPGTGCTPFPACPEGQEPGNPFP